MAALHLSAICTDCGETWTSHVEAEDAVEFYRAVTIHNATEHGIPLPAPIGPRRKARHYLDARLHCYYDPGCA